MAFVNIVGIGENPGNQSFLLSHKVFYPIKDKNYHLTLHHTKKFWTSSNSEHLQTTE